MSVVQQRAGEIGVLAAVGSGAGCGRGAKQVRAHLHTDGESVVLLITRATSLAVRGAPSFADSHRAEVALSDRASTGLCWPR